MTFHWTLSRQLQVWMAAALVTILLVFGGLWWLEQRSHNEISDAGAAFIAELAKHSAEERGVALSMQLSESVRNPWYFSDLEALGNEVAAIRRLPGVVEVLVVDDRGRIVHDGTPDIERFGESLEPIVLGAVRTGQEVRWEDGQLRVASSVEIGDVRMGSVRLRMDIRSVEALQSQWLGVVNDEMAQSSEEHQRWLMVGMAGVLALGLAGMFFLRHRIVAPLKTLAAASAAVEAGRYHDARVDTERGDEIGDLTRAFARMAEGVARHERDIRRIAYSDPLTGLGNRLALGESLESRLLTLQATSGELALLFIDLDDIKHVNDSMGHQAGDELLVEMATRIREACDFVGLEAAELARFGGDEFIVLHAGTDVRAQASRLAEYLLNRTRAPVLLHGREIVAGASIGISVFPDDAASAAHLLKNADMAMYQAKSAGKGCYRFYSKAVDEALERRVRIAHDLRGAWDRGEIKLAFQPVFDLTDGRPVGAEALLRWNHPELGLVPPSVFVQVAEESGQVDELGRAVLREATRVAAGWRGGVGGGKAPFVAVNVSPRQLLAGDLRDTVNAALDASGLAPERLHLELTETAILRDEAQATAAFTQLRARGVGVWLDDFGTGFSGLSHLRRVPVDGVKIDRSFVTDLLRDPNDLALTTGVISMAHSLGITVVAEGIENEGQYAVLRERGCQLGQGFHLGRPLPAEDMTRLFAQTS